MRKRIFYILLLLVFGLTGCDDSGDTIINTPQSLVVEGWIENGEFPIVIVTKTLPVSTESQNIKDLSEYLVRWAKVTVSDGERSVVLTGLYDENYYPPYVYTTAYMRGELGKSYHLTVEYEGQTLTSTTTIPSTLPLLDHYRIDPCEGTGNQYQITTCFYDNPHEKNYYLFFTKTGFKSKHYLGAYLGAINDEMIDNYVEYPVYREHQYNDNDYTPYFNAGEFVSVKMAQVDSSTFLFWDQYTKSQTLTSNMFLSTSTPLPCNISGGVGYWSGFASVTSYFEIR